MRTAVIAAALAASSALAAVAYLNAPPATSGRDALTVVTGSASSDGATAAATSSGGDAVPATESGAQPQGQYQAGPQAASSANRPFQVTPVADFDAPWAMTFLPDGRMLVTEKAGRLMLVSADGQRRVEVSGLPAVDSAGQGGLMDVVLAPGYAADPGKGVFLSASQSGPGGKGVVLLWGKLTERNGQARLGSLHTLFRAEPFVGGDGHYSGRIAFSPNGRQLFFTAGERQQFTPSQDPKSTLGKVLRLNLNGTPHRGNPLAAQGFHPAVWSYGHRNLLGLAFDGFGNLWQQEMGPQGGDELNLVLAGRNYGYPNASNGDHYDGRDIPDHRPGDGYEAPRVWWNPAISPGGLMIYQGSMFPDWRGDAFLGGLGSRALIRVDLNGQNAAKANQWDMGARIREVEQGPDGAIYVLEDGPSGGRLLRLTPVG